MQLRIAVLLALIATHLTLGQGTFIFDQQSSDESRILEGGFGLGVGTGTGVQSFTPRFDSIGFLKLVVFVDAASKFAVNVRSGSPSGPILGTTDTLTVPKTSSQTPITLHFSTQVGLTPGTTYYLEPTALLNGGLVNQSLYQYPGGTLFFDGVPNQQTYDMWFREGIVVPEPAAVSLTLVAGFSVLWSKRKRSTR
jgi:hypothetical protein